MKMNCWITMQLPDDKERRRVWVKQDPKRNNKGLVTRARRIRKGDIVAIYVYNDQHAPRGIKYIGKIRRLLDFKVDAVEKDGTQWLRVAEMEKELLADNEHICHLYELASILEPNQHFDNNSACIRAVLRKCGGSIGKITEYQMRQIWHSFPDYTSQLEESAKKEMADFAEINNEPKIPRFPPQIVKKVIERYAVNKAIEYLQNMRFSPDPYQERSPYDLKYMVKGKEHYLEVKGTQNPEDKAMVFLTPREVEHARNNEERWKLFIVHSIIVDDAEGKPVPRGGVVCVKRWPEISELLKVCLYQTQVTG